MEALTKTTNSANARYAICFTFSGADGGNGMLGGWADDEIGPVPRGGLIASQTWDFPDMGLAMMRYVWKIEPVASMR
jgi:hypothetical protein